MFYERFREICKQKNTTATAVVKALGLSSGNMTNWKNGRKPKTDIALKIANYLNVSVEYLMGESIKKENPTANSDETLMFALYGDDNKDITPDMLDDVRKFAQFVREQRKKDSQ